MGQILKGKRILVVDDEPDILETLIDLLDMCFIDTAPDFETAKKFLNKNDYDVAILDIMGVKGFDLLQLANKKGIPALMLTAHALNPENLVKSIKEGARAYVPKDKITDIATYVEDVLQAQQEGVQRDATWFARLKPFFDQKFEKGWQQKNLEFWKKFDQTYRVSGDEMRDIID